MELHYKTHIRWTGNKGSGTSAYTEYERSHELSIEHKPDIHMSSDKPFRGDESNHNPEDFLLASLSSCHMLWYLHLCADAGVIVVSYEDNASGILDLNQGMGRFTEVILRPKVTITEASMKDKAELLHHKAHEHCFIANSVNFAVLCKPEILLP